jgi:hypothetical protein
LFALKTKVPIHNEVGEKYLKSFKLTEIKKEIKLGRKGERGRRKDNDIPSQNSSKFNKNRKIRTEVWRGG